MILLAPGVAFASLAGCAGPCAETECTTAAGERTRVQQELAQFLKAYRVCLQKYEGDPDKSREICSVYTQALAAMEQKGLKLK
jgi:hypothetical protein